MDAATDNLTHLEIASEAGHRTIRAWGKCSPSDCDWGPVTLESIADDPVSPQASRFFAIWDQGFAASYVAFYTDADGTLIAEEIRLFRDKSGRKHFRNVERFRRPQRPAR